MPEATITEKPAVPAKKKAPAAQYVRQGLQLFRVTGRDADYGLKLEAHGKPYPTAGAARIALFDLAHPDEREKKAKKHAADRKAASDALRAARAIADDDKRAEAMIKADAQAREAGLHA